MDGKRLLVVSKFLVGIFYVERYLFALSGNVAFRVGWGGDCWFRDSKVSLGGVIFIPTVLSDFSYGGACTSGCVFVVGLGEEGAAFPLWFLGQG